MTPSIPARVRRRIRRNVLANSGPLARWMLFRDRSRAPARQRVVDVARDAGIGDVIMCTPALRELKRINPQGRIRFYTNFGELVRGLPYIDEVLPFSERPPESIFVEYTDIMPSRVHIGRLIGDRLGVAVTDVQPDCVAQPTIANAFRRSWADLPQPRIVVLRRASRFTPNKDWPDASWAELIATLSRFATVIEIGVKDGASPSSSAGPTYVDLRGDTSIPELVGAIEAADLYVGPVSGPMHIAAALGVPSVAIIGGYEHPDNSQYRGNTTFYTELPCSPCWLREPCPFDLRCLRAISVGQVVQAIKTTWSAHSKTLAAVD